MGIEPTWDFVEPHHGFEDQDTHQQCKRLQTKELPQIHFLHAISMPNGAPTILASKRPISDKSTPATKKSRPHIIRIGYVYIVWAFVARDLSGF